ncbi:hypothetical protein Syun_012969 [Stephania yunnanensis]|uniref:Peroxisomal membrane protein PEX16 n=1 Tax=Stephania yunnanensis TaxID=152371 RepID=A0AAP0K159_9MAGN
MEGYKRWIRRNKEYVHSMESLANGLTWLLPERFSASEIGPEAVTAILGMITTVNEHIIDQVPVSIAQSSSSSLFPWSLCVSVIKDAETLIEVAAEHYYGAEKKWNFIAVTEAAKVLVRLALFRDSGYKMLLQGGETPNKKMDTSALNSNQGLRMGLNSGTHSRAGGAQGYYAQDPRNLEGRAISALSRFGESARMVSDPAWLKRLQHHQAMTAEPPTSVVKKPTLYSILSERGLSGGLFLIQEVLHITRPLIYVLLIRKYGTRSWKPWVLSLAVDLTGAGILSQILCVRHQRREGHLLSNLEKNEVSRRKLLWALYLMRDPFFSTYTKERLERTEKLLEPIPVIGFLTAKLVELVIGAQSRYTYMAGS